MRNNNVNNKTNSSSMKNLKNYIFPIVGICTLIIGNAICYNVNDRFLNLSTNAVIGLLTVLSVSSSINNKDA
jgi:hypothetical protein